MASILSLVIPALIPALADGIRGVFGKLTGGAGAKPQNVEEQIKLMAAENERLKALAELDKPAENISPWVADLRASFRYIAGGGLGSFILRLGGETVCSDWGLF